MKGGGWSNNLVLQYIVVNRQYFLQLSLFPIKKCLSNAGAMIDINRANLYRMKLVKPYYSNCSIKGLQRHCTFDSLTILFLCLREVALFTLRVYSVNSDNCLFSDSDTEMPDSKPGLGWGVWSDHGVIL